MLKIASRRDVLKTCGAFAASACVDASHAFSAQATGYIKGTELMRYVLTFTCIVLCAAGALTQAAEQETARPNLVVIYADDLGYGDVQCYNPDRGKIPTPNIDRLASQGMRFTDAHSSSGVCSPSRYTLLTGRYHWRTRLQSGIVGKWGAPLIAPDRLTLAGLLRQCGCRSACIGKWHLG